MHRTDYDFDVISGPSTQAAPRTPASQAVSPSATPPRPPGAAPLPARSTEATAGAGEKV